MGKKEPARGERQEVRGKKEKLDILFREGE
jgi:hypothetical protein